MTLIFVKRYLKKKVLEFIVFVLFIFLVASILCNIIDEVIINYDGKLQK